MIRNASSRPTTCIGVDRDRYGRVVANCSRADVVSVNRWLVREGWALDWVHYSHGAHAAAQKAAKTEKRGILGRRFRDAMRVPGGAGAPRIKVLIST